MAGSAMCSVWCRERVTMPLVLSSIQSIHHCNLCLNSTFRTTSWLPFAYVLHSYLPQPLPFLRSPVTSPPSLYAVARPSCSLCRLDLRRCCFGGPAILVQPSLLVSAAAVTTFAPKSRGSGTSSSSCLHVMLAMATGYQAVSGPLSQHHLRLWCSRNSHVSVAMHDNIMILSF